MKEKELRPEPLIGWNCASGGKGGNTGPFSEERKEKMKDKLKGEKNPFFGKHHSDETKKLISETLMKKSPEWRAENASKGGKKGIGKVRSKESKDKYSDVALNRPKYTCEWCGKIGQHNSMIGYHGDNCPKNPNRIPKDRDIQTFQRGQTLGRKMKQKKDGIFREDNPFTTRGAINHYHENGSFKRAIPETETSVLLIEQGYCFFSKPTKCQGK